MSHEMLPRSSHIVSVRSSQPRPALGEKNTNTLISRTDHGAFAYKKVSPTIVQGPVPTPREEFGLFVSIGSSSDVEVQEVCGRQTKRSAWQMEPVEPHRCNEIDVDSKWKSGTGFDGTEDSDEVRMSSRVVNANSVIFRGELTFYRHKMNLSYPMCRKQWI